MDDHRFDLLTRAFATRRAALVGVLAALAPTAGIAGPGAKDKDKPKDGPEAARCVANGRRCGAGSGKRGKKDVSCATCCSRFATPKGTGPRRCSCKPEGNACANAAQCCGGQCTAGRCRPCQPGLTACGSSGCVDLQTDRQHCGSCPNACAAGQACVAGACTCGGADCAGCCDGATCRAGTTDANCGKDGATCGSCANPAPICTDNACGPCTTDSQCASGEICASGQCVTGIGTCPAGANACLAFVSCNGNPDCFCLPTRTGATRCARYYETSGGFLRPCNADADCANLGPGAFCPPRFNSCGGVCSLPC